jgi:hypothetical protein
MALSMNKIVHRGWYYRTVVACRLKSGSGAGFGPRIVGCEAAAGRATRAVPSRPGPVDERRTVPMNDVTNCGMAREIGRLSASNTRASPGGIRATC